MFQDTQPADLNAAGGTDPWGEFRVRAAQERLALLRQLRDGAVPVMVSTPSGAGLTSTVWALDATQQRLNLSADEHNPGLAALVEADEAVAVAYLDNVKLQFDLQQLCLVRGHNAVALQCALPQEIYRFQRRGAYRVRPQPYQAPTARLRHPALPEMLLSLRVLDVSLGGCALWLPRDVPEMQPGTLFAQVDVALDAETRFTAALTLQHVTALSGAEGGARLGCEWRPLSGSADRVLQRWIEQAQKRRRLLKLD
jgi:c-di-GMP-binding flagellar brake protein YcgR